MVCWILLLALLEHESGISLYLVTRDLTDCHNLSKVIESHSVMVADSSQHPWMDPMQTCRFVFCSVCLRDLQLNFHLLWVVIHPLDFASGFLELEGLRESLVNKDWDNEGNEQFSLSVTFSLGPLLCSVTLFSFTFLLLQYPCRSFPCCPSNSSPISPSSHRTLAPSVPPYFSSGFACSEYSSVVLLGILSPAFTLCMLPIAFKSSHESLVSPVSLLCIRTVYSSALTRLSVKNDQISWVPLLFRAASPIWSVPWPKQSPLSWGPLWGYLPPPFSSGFWILPSHGHRSKSAVI